MPSSSFILSVGAILSALSTTTTATKYNLQDSYQGSNFLDGFDFFDKPDPTNGFVKYVGQTQARNSQLTRTIGSDTYLGVDYTTPLSVAGNVGRSSVRIETKKSYNQGLFVVDIKHMPGGVCGTWPAFWSLGSGEWPKNGEIDIIEGVNQNNVNKWVLHTDTNCKVDGKGQTGRQLLNDCALDTNGPSGCDVNAVEGNTYGTGFNANGGGVYAMEWTGDAIKMWFFPRGRIPASITADKPDTADFGIPNANFQGDCDIDKKFKDHRFIFNTAFCGDWAGNVYGESSCRKYAGLNSMDSCKKFVAENPAAFRQAYWLIGSFKTYNKAPQTVSSSSSVQSSTQSSTTISIHVSSSTQVSSSSVQASSSTVTPVASSSSSSASQSYGESSSSSVDHVDSQSSVDSHTTTTVGDYATTTTVADYATTTSVHYGDLTSSSIYYGDNDSSSSSADYQVQSSSTAAYNDDVKSSTIKYDENQSSSNDDYSQSTPSAVYPSYPTVTLIPGYVVYPTTTPVSYPSAPKPTDYVTTTYTTEYTDICPTGYTKISTTLVVTYPSASTSVPSQEIEACPPGFTVTEKYCGHGCGDKPTYVKVTVPATSTKTADVYSPPKAYPTGPASSPKPEYPHVPEYEHEEEYPAVPDYEQPKEYPSGQGHEQPKEYPAGPVHEQPKEYPAGPGYEHPQEYPQGPGSEHPQEYPKVPSSEHPQEYPAGPGSPHEGHPTGPGYQHTPEEITSKIIATKIVTLSIVPVPASQYPHHASASHVSPVHPPAHSSAVGDKYPVSESERPVYTKPSFTPGVIPEYTPVPGSHYISNVTASGTGEVVPSKTGYIPAEFTGAASSVKAGGLLGGAIAAAFVMLL